MVVSGTTQRRTRRWAALTRPALRDGLHVVRRDDRHLQIGLDDPDRLVLPDRPGLLEALSHLDHQPPDDVCDVVDRLVDDGWVVDLAAQAEQRRSTVARRPPVALTVDPLLEDAVSRACRTAGLRVVPEAGSRLVVTQGEPSRALSDALMRDDVPHLWVTLRPHRVCLGPYVDPGRSACLRCVDAHLGERDPRRATALHQVTDLPRSPYPVLDAAVLDLAVAWAVRDVCRRLDGLQPSLRSATVTVTDHLEITRAEWLRHPHCGCAWG